MRYRKSNLFPSMRNDRLGLSSGLLMTLPIIAVVCLLFMAIPFPSMNAKEEEAEPVIVVVPIEGVIGKDTELHVQRCIAGMTKINAALVIFEIDTNGGDVNSSVTICDAIMELGKTVKTCAFVTSRAWSAGAMIAIACKEIFMRPNATIGSAEPKLGGILTDEKYTSALKSKFRAYAQANGHHAGIAEAMVDKDITLIEVFIGGQRYILKPEEKDRELEKEEHQGKRYKEGKVIVEAGKLLNLVAQEAEEFGFCTKILNTREDIAEHYNLKGLKIVQLSPSWTEILVGFVSNPIVTVVLIIVGLICLFIELKMPGFGVAGVIALACFMLLVFGNYLAGLANIAEIILLFLGLVLLFLELFVLPGFGVVGIFGILCILTSLVLMMQGFLLPIEGAPWQSDILIGNISRVLLGFVGAMLLVFIANRLLPSTPYFKGLILKTAQVAEAGYTVAEKSLSFLTGEVGIAHTPLRPAGKIEIGDQYYDAVADKDFIEKGQKVRVVRVEGNKIIVDKA